MEWSIDLTVLMLVLGLSALLVLPRPELAQVRLPYGLVQPVDCALVLKSHNRSLKSLRTVFVRRKRPPRSSECSDSPCSRSESVND
ncbi:MULTISPECIES: hypothetical protein [unclassified Paenibacillus]|uniref:hypothetical protein n=1 Tax=unclassified Paenibacillus TaxID=185978 RepID=UPI00191594C8|nr:hypothetical protein [Paenibacillus sp. EPM92]